MSKKGNSVFSAVVPVLGAAQTTTPISLQSMSLGIGAVSKAINHSQSTTSADPTVRYSTGSTLLDSFVQDAEYDAFTLQTELTSLSLELKRIADPRFRAGASRGSSGSDRRQRRPQASPKSEAIRAKQEAIAKARQEAQRQAMRAIQQAKQQQESVAKPAYAPTPLALPTPPRTPERQPTHSSRPSAPLSAPTSAIKVYGGDDYKAMQARAQAGGLVNLEDDLLFGGTEKSAAKGAKTTALPEPNFLDWLTQPLEDFTRSPVPGGWHPTAHLDEASQRSVDAWCQSVLGIDSFKLTELETGELETGELETGELETGEDLRHEGALYTEHHTEHSTEHHTEHSTEHQSGEAANNKDTTPQGSACDDDNRALQTSNQAPVAVNEADGSELAALDTLGKQVTYLNQRIEFLSKKLAEMTGAETSVNGNRQQTPNRHRRSSVVLGIDTFDLSDETASERRLATLKPLASALSS